MHISRTSGSSTGLTTYTPLKRCHLYPWDWFHTVICWVITWCWCDFLRGQKNWLKISTERHLAAASLPCWAPFHYNCRRVSCCFRTFSENHSEVVGKAGNQMLWDSGKLCGLRVTQSLLHPLVRLQGKVNSAQNSLRTLQAFPLQINISTYSVSSVTEHTKENKKRLK